MSTHLDCAALRTLLSRLDGRGYKAYKDLRGAYDLGSLELFIDHVQGDPFAAPSLVRLRVPMARAALPEALFSTSVRRLALCDALARELRAEIGRRGATAGSAGSGKSGLVRVDAGGQEVLERSALRINEDWVEARIEVGLPAAGRRVRGGRAEVLLCELLPALAERALCWAALPQQRLRRFVECVENQEHVRARLDELGLIAWVGNGALLARESGASDRPMRGAACVPFVSPPSLEVEIEVPNPVDDAESVAVDDPASAPVDDAASESVDDAKSAATDDAKSEDEADPGADAPRRHLLRGLGIRAGVTLIVGGGYHGKSTLLRALERGVYAHVPGDGREIVVAARGLVKIRAEDGRSVQGVDIEPYVREIPGARGAGSSSRSTRHFSTADASGSTSQAANIVEAVEAGATGILLDEDTCATNFMVRDARMQALVERDAEPITPFLDRVRELWEVCGISTVLVMGGSGDYFDVADTVIAMRGYEAREATAEARAVAEQHPSARSRDALSRLARPAPRVPLREGFRAARGRRDVSLRARGIHELLYGEESVDLRGLEQLVDTSQTRAVGAAIHWAAQELCDGERTLAELLDGIEELLDRRGLDPLDPFYRPGQHPGNFARPRRFEIAAAINRLRSLRILSQRAAPELT